MSERHPREILRGLEQRARKRFGQHFLVQRDVVIRMVRGAGVKPDDRVVEVGPGLGILTRALREGGARLTAVELDRDLAQHIRETMPDVRLVEADALGVNWPELCPGSGWKVVANLPYNVGTPLVMTLLRYPGTFASLSVMLQREVADRLMALPGSKTYGALSIRAQARATIRPLVQVPPNAFHPPPKVRSSVIRLDLLPEPDFGPAGEAAFERVVRGAFSQRRKTLVNALGPLYGRAEVRAAAERAEIEPSLRAEALSLEAFRRLAAELESAVDAGSEPEIG